MVNTHLPGLIDAKAPMKTVEEFKVKVDGKMDKHKINHKIVSDRQLKL